MSDFGRICLLLLSFVPSIASAQNDNLGPVEVVPPQASDNPQTVQGSPTEPLPLSGAQEITVTDLRNQSVLSPRLRVMQVFDSNPAGGNPNSGGAADGATIYASLIFQRERKRSETKLRLGAGGTFYPSQSNLNSNYQNISIGQMITLRRWAFLFASELFHSPKTNFGDLEHYTQPALMDETGLSQVMLPNQSVFTQQLSRLSFSNVGEARYRLGSRISLTASAGFSQLRFLVNGLSDVRQFTFLTGVNRALNARDTVTLAYGHNIFDFHGIRDPIHTDFVEAAYGHKLSGKLVFDVSVGPEVLKNAFDSGSHVYIGGHSSLHYRAGGGDLMLTFSRSITGGSGVLLGAQTNTFELHGALALSRRWAGSALLGYAQNANLQNAKGNKPLLGGYAGLTIERTLSPYALLFFGFNLQSQNRGGPCLTAGCSAGLTRNQIIGGIDLSFRPIHIR